MIRRVLRATSPGDVARAMEIRFAVFVGEQGVPTELERDELDDTCDHFLAFAGDEPVGAGRLVVEPGEPGPVGHLGRLAVLAPYRHAGIGVALVEAIEARAVELGLAEVYLGAQLHATGFYERLGYAPFGEQFWDAGIRHIHMRKHMRKPVSTRPAAAAPPRGSAP